MRNFKFPAAGLPPLLVFCGFVWLLSILCVGTDAIDPTGQCMWAVQPIALLCVFWYVTRKWINR